MASAGGAAGSTETGRLGAGVEGAEGAGGVGGIRGGGRPGRDGGLGGSAPRILTVLGKMTRLVTAPAFVPIGTVGSFMGTFADGTLKWLTSIPYTTRITLDVTLERCVVVQRHTHNAGTSGYVLKTRETLQCYLVHGPKWQKGQTKPHIACLDRQVVNVNTCHRRVRCGDIKKM